MIDIAKAISDADVRRRERVFRGLEAGRVTKVVGPTPCRKATSAREPCASPRPKAAPSRSAAASSCCRRRGESATAATPHSGFIDYVPVGASRKARRW